MQDEPSATSNESSTRWIMTIRAGCFLRMLYVRGMIMTTAAGDAESDRRASRFTKDASKFTGRCLSDQMSDNHGDSSYVQLT